MTSEDRLVADFHNTGMTVGPHPLRYHREDLRRQGVVTAIELHRLRDGTPVRVAGSVIARQRPGTAKGFVFLSLEDETGISNAILTPQIFRQHHVVVVHQQFLLLEGVLQNQENVISVKVRRSASAVSHESRDRFARFSLIDSRHDCQKRRPSTQCALKTARSSELAPFQKIWTPMQTSKNDDSRMITLIPVGADQRCEAVGKAVTDVDAEGE